ncbi:HlyD family efflux transporter periplasmic adaptor subunit [Streptomyces sp. NPDC046887]|uniref:HlyD family efflux transporter periplasmic adaptor subunit n=1 Tax=Streptomyces sp. NPDC046887 TaxID=3155472 RepID=UPI0034105A79
MQFRQQALSRLQSPEEIDLPVRLARPQGLLVLSVTLLAVAAAALWAVTGTVSATVRAPAVLTHGQGGYVLQSPVTGQVTGALVEEGDRVAQGAPLFELRTAEGARSVVRAPAPGRVTALASGIGTVVTTGADLASVERVAHPDDPLTAVVYVPADRAASLAPGAAVDLTVDSAPVQRYGVLRGQVREVGRTPQSRQRITAFLGSGELAAELSRDGRPVAVLVRLTEAPRTASGYAWSASDGPGRPLESMTLASGSVHLPDQHPIDWLLP